ncbi:phage infection protein [Streptococcus criceti]|uniref:Type VII secretion system accessory factor EsaA n=1 Tax=Streptococcus criceti HS-6 TaxID=873449 RepID=G5JNV0_STRCG|nr:type VII secretion protein EsaA family protein [Streptococcus criceti HS-6]SUN41759.1 phage infection protein [Streptococcus criceti]
MKKRVPKALKLVGNIVLIVALFFGILGLNIWLQRVHREKAVAEANRLNIAVINEDRNVTDKKETYHLGDDYVKTLERDDSQNWTVTTRSTAESGLKSGRYQLAVYIPSNFSSKVLDINNVLVDKATVTYKINAKGSQRVEAKAKQAGDKIVSDLNSRLVNMYMASVLGNLYTAQQNAQTVSGLQHKTAGTYQATLYQPVINFENVFPSLTGLSNSSLQSSLSLSKALSEAAQKAEQDGVDTSDMMPTLTSLIADYSQGEISAKDYTQGTMQMGTKELSTQLSAMIDALEKDRSSVSGLLGTVPSEEAEGDASNPDRANNNEKNHPEGDDRRTIDDSQRETDDSSDKEKNYQESLEQASAQLDKLETQLRSVKEKNDNSDQTKPVEDVVREELEKYYGKALEQVTVKDLLAKDPSLNQSLETYQARLTSLKNLVSQSVSALPADKVADVAGDLKGVTETDYSSQINQYTDDSSASNYGYSTGDAAGLKSNLASAAQAVRDYDTEDVKASTEVKTETQASLSWDKDKVTIDSWYVTKEDGTKTDPVSPDTPITVDLSQNNTFHYNIKPNSEAQESGVVNVKLGGVSVNQTEGKTIDVKDYAQKVEAYAQAAQAVVAAYNHTGSLLKAYYPNGADQSGTDDFLNQSTTDLLVSLLTPAISNALNTYSSDVEVDQALTTLKESRQTLRDKLGTIISTNNQVEADISATLDLLKQLQTGSAGKVDEKAAKERSDKSSDLSKKLAKLISQSQALKSSAQSNAKAASSVSKTFDSFNKAAQKAQDDGKKLSADAKVLMTKFNQELSETNDFVKSFKDVLDNAYDNGVPNEALLEFLSSPVVSRSSSYKSRVTTAKPFTWILLLAVISLFSAYLFATQDLIGRVKNQFTKGLFSDTDPLNVGTLSALALIEGMALGIASARSMALDRDLVPSWILIFVLFSLVLLHGQYFVLKHLRSLGMGLVLYNLVSFVYFSNALGASVGLTGWMRQLKHWNFLSLMEKTLATYVDHITADSKLIVLLLLAVVVVIALNMLVRFPWEVRSQEVSEKA